MNLAHLHLLLNHFPIIGTLIGFGILLYGVFSNKKEIIPTGIFILVLMALIAIPVFLTGEPAEDSVKNIPGIIQSSIEEHEEAAGFALGFMEVTGMLGLISLFLHYRKSEKLKILFIATLIFSAITFGAMARTGYLGGKIRHSEINGNNTTSPLQENENDGDDD